MGAVVMIRTPMLRTLVVCSWISYAIGLFLEIPIPEEAIVTYLLGFASALVGLTASVAAMANFRAWRVLAIVAAWAFLFGYAGRFFIWAKISAHSGETSLIYGFANVANDSFLIAQHFYQTAGIVGASPFVFSVFAMPLIQLIVIGLLRTSPNPSYMDSPQ
jgi:hypothetical protein